MREDEHYVRRFYAAELKIRRRETELMARDEELYKKKLKFDAAREKELLEVDRKVKAAVTWALNILGTARGKLGIAKRSLKSHGARGPAHGNCRQGTVRRGHETRPVDGLPEGQIFCVEDAQIAQRVRPGGGSSVRSRCSFAIDAKNAALTSEAALEFLYFEFLREFLADICEDGLKVRASRRNLGRKMKRELCSCSRSTCSTACIPFYRGGGRRGGRRWLNKQTSSWRCRGPWTIVTSDLRILGRRRRRVCHTDVALSSRPPRAAMASVLHRRRATNKQDQVRMEEERRRRLSLVKDEEAKEAHEKELRTAASVDCGARGGGVASARAFYEYEFQNNLGSGAT